MQKNRIGGAEIFLIISCALVVIFGCLYFGLPSFAQKLSGISGDVQKFALAHGYWGGFFITTISNAALVIPIPYGTVLFVLGGVGLNPWLLGLLTGLGAGLGEIVAYFVGRGAGTLVSAEQQQQFQRINAMIARRPRLVPLLIFLFGVTPIPDDIILIPLGMIRYPFWKTILPDLAGKLIMTTFFSVAGRYSLSTLQRAFGDSGGWWSGAVLSILTILAIYFTLKIKWEKLI